MLYCGDKFKEEMDARGIADSRQQDLATALHKLHGALAYLDLEQRAKVAKLSLQDWLKLYARSEGMIEIVAEIWKDEKVPEVANESISSDGR